MRSLPCKLLHCLHGQSALDERYPYRHRISSRICNPPEPDQMGVLAIEVHSCIRGLKQSLKLSKERLSMKIFSVGLNMPINSFRGLIQKVLPFQQGNPGLAPSVQFLVTIEISNLIVDINASQVLLGMLRDVASTSARLNSAIVPCVENYPKLRGKRRVNFTEEGFHFRAKKKASTDNSNGWREEAA